MTNETTDRHTTETDGGAVLFGSLIDRRVFLRMGGAAAATAVLAACGSSAKAAGGSATANSASATSVAGTAAGGGAAAAPSGTITATSAFTLSGGFDPMNASSAVATAVNAHVFEGLVNLDPITSKPYLALAASEPTVSADGLTWTVPLRQGATFSDGTAVTADDVAWSFTRVLNPANNALIAGFISFIDTVTAVDAQTVQFKLNTPFSLFAQRIAVVPVVPQSKTATSAAASAFNNAPIGSGPFTVQSANSTSGVVMGVNSHYKGSKPALVKSIDYRTTPDNSARLNDLLSGSSQAIEEVPYLDVSNANASPDHVDGRQGFNCLFLMFNCSAAPFNDKRVRQALFYAIDTTKVIQTALQGYATAATCYLNEGNAAYQRAATVYTYDPNKARSLLSAAGVSNLSFELVTTNTGFVADCAPVIIDSWKQAGINATLNTSPTSAVYGTIVPAPSFRVLAASGDPSVFGPDADLLLRWFYYGKTWPQERERWTDAAAQQCASLIDQAAQANGATQTALWKQIFDLVADEVPLYPLFHSKTLTGYNPSQLVNFQGAATTGMYFLDVARKG